MRGFGVLSREKLRLQLHFVPGLAENLRKLDSQRARPITPIPDVCCQAGYRRSGYRLGQIHDSFLGLTNHCLPLAFERRKILSFLFFFLLVN